MSYKIPFSLNEPKILSQNKDFFFDEYNYYFNEREKLKKEIAFSLNEKTIPYSFKNWFRLTRTKYVMNPLSCKGSVENSIGGRFNIGNISKDRFPVFPALYIGNGKKTCVKEIYPGMEHFFNSNRGDSFFRISGHIYSVLDITKKEALGRFIKTIKQIKLSKALQSRAEKLDLKKRQSLQSVTELKTSIYDINWRKYPNIYNIPSPPQVFGQLARYAGIEAIVYKSTKKSKAGLCMAVFPENFKHSDSYVKLEDCPKEIVNQIMSAETFENFY